VYRRAIDDAVAGREFDMTMMDELEGLSNRGYTEGFYRRHPPAEYQNYETGVSRSDRQQLVGEISDRRDGWLTVLAKNRFVAGDRMELVTPSGNVHFTLDVIEDRDGRPLDAVPGSGHVAKIAVPEGIEATAIDEFAMLVRHLPRDEDSAAA
jgi:putative protease